MTRLISSKPQYQYNAEDKNSISFNTLLANSEDQDKTAPTGAVLSGSTQFAIPSASQIKGDFVRNQGSFGIFSGHWKLKTFTILTVW